MSAADTDIISLSDDLAEHVRRHLGTTSAAVDVLAPLEDMVLAIGDALPLATLSVIFDRCRPDAVMALRADGRLDSVDARLAA